MEGLKSFLRRPHPISLSPGVLIGFGGIVVLIFLVLAPFGLSRFPLLPRAGLALGFGLITVVSIVLVVTGFRLLFPKWTAPDQWTLGREFLLSLVIMGFISLGVFALLRAFINSSQPSASLFLWVVGGTFAVGLIPMTVMTLLEQFRLDQKHLAEAQLLNQELKVALQKLEEKRVPSSQNHIPETDKMAVFHAESGKPELQLPLRDLLFLQSSGNYVEVFFLKNGDSERKLVRNRLGTFEAELGEGPFFRCHKSFLVNLDQVREVKGNARALELVLSESGLRVPVSRSKVDDLKLALRG